MAAILRVKRSRTDDPADSLVISSKRYKIDSASDGASVCAPDTVDKIFKFAGTVEKKNTPVGKQVRDAIRKSKLEKEILRQHDFSPSTLTRHVREERRKHSADSRYKVISQKRTIAWEKLDEAEEEEDITDDAAAQEGQKLFHLLDLVQDFKQEVAKAKKNETITCNGVMQRVVEEKDCVYDLYYVNDPKMDFKSLYNLSFVGRWEQHFIDEREDSDDENVYDDEDLEAEDNPRNDYPDEQDSDDESDEEGHYKEHDPFDNGCEDDDYFAQMIEDRLTLGDYSDDGGFSEDDDEDGGGFVY